MTLSRFSSALLTTNVVLWYYFNCGQIPQIPSSVANSKVTTGVLGYLAIACRPAVCCYGKMAAFEGSVGSVASPIVRILMAFELRFAIPELWKNDLERNIKWAVERCAQIISGDPPIEKQGGYKWQLDMSNDFWADHRPEENEFVVAYRYGDDKDVRMQALRRIINWRVFGADERASAGS